MMQHPGRNTMQGLGAVVGLSLAATWLAVMLYDATTAVKLVSGVVATYVVLSLFLHPFWNVVRHPFSLVVLGKLMILFGYVFNALFISTAVDTEPDRTLVFVLLAGLAAVLGADLGTSLLRPRAAAGGDQGAGGGVERTIFIVIFVVGWLWRLYALSTGKLYGTIIGTGLELTGESNALGVLNSVAGLAAWGALIFGCHRKLAVWMIVLEAAWLMITGSKGSVLYIVITYLMLTTGGRSAVFNRRIVLIGVAGLVIFVAGFVVIHSYRVAAESQIKRRGFVDFNPVEAIGEMTVRNEDIQLVGISIAKRLSLASRFSLVVDTPSSDREDPWLGRSYLTALFWAVPRSVWPDKPSMSLGRWYAETYYGWGENIKGEAGVTIWGEAYLNFREAGALIIPALWLIFLQLIYVASWRLGPWGLLFLAKIYYVAMNSLASNVSMVAATLGSAVMIMLFLYLLTRVARVSIKRLEALR